MKVGNILNSELSYAIASMGHGDWLFVVDAGFPIPPDAWRIDLALVPDVPDMETVVTAVMQEFIAEKVMYATELIEKKSPYLATIERLFPDIEKEALPHEIIRDELAPRAKAIVRTGALQPWGNVVLQSGVDWPVWSAKLPAESR